MNYNIKIKNIQDSKLVVNVIINNNSNDCGVVVNDNAYVLDKDSNKDINVDVEDVVNDIESVNNISGQNHTFNSLFNELESQINCKDEKYIVLKKRVTELEKIYLYLKNYENVSLLHNCGSYLEFVLNCNENIDRKKLKRVNSCKLRLCPFCSWRKSLKVFANVRKCYDYLIDNYKGSRFVFVTLTRKNIKVDYVFFGKQLIDEVSDILNCFRKLTHKAKDKNSKVWNSAFLGFIRSLEITYDKEKVITHKMFLERNDYYKKRGLCEGDLNPNYDTFHVHLHVLCHTTYDIYSKNFIDFKVLQLMWAEVCNLNYMPSVDIRSFKARNMQTKGRELAEMAKYCIKLDDCITGDLKQDSKILDTLDSALFRRRLISYSGTFGEARKKLKLNDDTKIEKEDLTGEEYIFKFFWDFKNKLYKKIK